jgi:hypothetical protein
VLSRTALGPLQLPVQWVLGASRHFSNKKKEYLKDEINELPINSKNKNIKRPL